MKIDDKKAFAAKVAIHTLLLAALGIVIYIHWDENRFPSAEEARIQTEKAVQKAEKKRQEYCSGKHISYIQKDIKNAIESGKKGVEAEVLVIKPYSSTHLFNCDAEVKYFLQQLSENQGYTYKSTGNHYGAAYYVGWD